MVMPMNVKEFNKFFGDQLAIFQISFFVQNAKFSYFVHFLSKVNFLYP